MTDQPEKLDLRSHDIAEAKREELLRLFPEIRTEGGKIDFDRLKLVLGEAVDVGRERYGMNWPGKAECLKAIQSPSLGTLLPVPDQSVNFDKTENLIIEGDNLEVLKLLQKSYLGKVKMIYIDPPYNTGNDFIYPDNYAEGLSTYLEFTGQADAEGRRFGTNTEKDGRFHSNWLSMIYSRLYLARNLLRDDGLILVSISDVELQNLRVVLDNIFGEENWLGTLVWKGATDNNPTRIAVEHEYLVCFARDKSAVPAVWTNQTHDAKIAMLTEYDRLRTTIGANTAIVQEEFRKFVRANAESLSPITHYNRVDDHGPFTGSRKVHNPKPGGYKYDVNHPVTGGVCVPPANGYRFPRATMDQLLADQRILFGDDETQIVQVKEYLSDYSGKLSSVLTLDSRAGANELESLFGDANVFPHPKPSALLREIFDFCIDDTSLVLDFFGGSGTTAQVVLELNERDGGSRKFILVQLPQPTENKSYPTIADITRERVRRVVQKLNDESAGSLDLAGDRTPDRGFRAFKLAESSFRPWDAEIATSKELEKQLDLHVDHMKEGRSTDDLMFEILLKSGYALTTPIETITLQGTLVRSASAGAFLICLEPELTLELVRAIADLKPERVVCLDRSFAGNDQLKANAVQIFKAKGITSFKTV